MVVDGVTKRWEAGSAIQFDDAFSHYAYNITPEERIVLLIEHWNPQVPHEVRPLLCDFVREWRTRVPALVFQLTRIDTSFDNYYGQEKYQEIQDVVALQNSPFLQSEYT